MLIKISGGISGIKDYLENGKKQGRELSRNELDNRIILDGNLAATDQIISLMETEGEKYLHITLAFKEDHVDEATLKNVIEEFKKFTFSAYEADEYNFYAEAHIPIIKSYTNSKSGEFIERKPHIHIVIPKENLLTGKTLNPFGMVDMFAMGDPNKIFIDAFQEHLNNIFGFSSPKDNLRMNFTGESEMISRYVGDFFEGSNKDIKNNILTAMLDRKISNYDDYKTLLAEFGEVRTRNEGKPNEYQNIKVPGTEKGINLDGGKSGQAMFSRRFIELPEDEKRALLKQDLTIKYEQIGLAKKSPEELLATLKEWHEVRAKEIKYINSGNRKFYKAYRAASYAERVEILAGYEQRFNDKYRKGLPNERSRSNYTTTYSYKRNGRIIATRNDQQLNLDANRSNTPPSKANRMRNLSSSLMDGNTQTTEMLLPNHERLDMDNRRAKRIDTLRWSSNLRKLLKPTGRNTDAVANQLLRDLDQSKKLRENEPTQKTIINSLEANRLLADLSLSHGVIPSKYEVTKNKDGVDRIKCGNRHLSVSDFLTKELQVPWTDAEKILQASYQKQLDNDQMLTKETPKQSQWASFKNQQRREYSKRAERDKNVRSQQKEKLADIKKTFYAKRSALLSDKSLKTAERKAAISIARMERLKLEEAIKAEFKELRKYLNSKKNKPQTEQYRDYLAEKVEQGNPVALEELRRMRDTPLKAVKKAPSIVNGSTLFDPIHKILPNMDFHVNAKNGDVTYKINNEDFLLDQGKRLQLLKTDDQSIEIGLRLARQSYGSKLTLTGTQEFQEQAAKVAAKIGLNVEFTDPAINKIMQDHKAELEASRNKGIETKEPHDIKPDEKQNSYAEAMAYANDNQLKVDPLNQYNQTGKILHRTAHHLIQDKGRYTVIIHEIEKLQLSKEQLEILKQGNKLEVDYRGDKPKVKITTPEQERENANNHQQGR